MTQLNLTDEQLEEAAFRMALRTVRLEVHRAVVEARSGTVDDEDEDELARAWEASGGEGTVVS